MEKKKTYTKRLHRIDQSEFSRMVGYGEHMQRESFIAQGGGEQT